MNKQFSSVFFYSYYARYFGIALILFGTAIFIRRIVAYDILDLAGYSFPFAMGLIMIFFSKEKTFDERLIYLKFKSLAIAIPVAALIAQVINYYHNFEHYSIETDSWYSISAFEYLSLVLGMAISLFIILNGMIR